MAGHSKTPLGKKHGIREAGRLALVGAPSGFARLLAPLPHDATILARVGCGWT